MPQKKFIKTVLLLGIWGAFLCFQIDAEEFNFSSSSYKVDVYIASSSDVEPKKEFLAPMDSLLRDRCRNYVGRFWEIKTKVVSSKRLKEIKSEPLDSIVEIESLDKIFFAEFDESTKQLRIQEFDVKTRRTGREFSFSVDHPGKGIDVLFQAIFEIHSPLFKLEKSSSESAFLISRGVENPSFQLDSVQKIGLPVKGTPLIVFVRSLDRDGNVVEVAPLPWTALVVESIDPSTKWIQCRVESGIQGALTTRRRGKTEILALAVPTSFTPTMIRLESRSTKEKKVRIFSNYEIMEQIPGESLPKRLGQTTTDGLFLLEADRNRSVRVCLIKHGRSLIARFPVVRGLESTLPVPIPDDTVRLDAESVIIALQEELIDQAARKSILESRLEKHKEQKEDAKVREIKAELARLKDMNRFLVELEQARLRFRSDDPVVQRRIDKMFRETKQIIEERF